MCTQPAGPSSHRLRYLRQRRGNKTFKFTTNVFLYFLLFFNSIRPCFLFASCVKLKILCNMQPSLNISLFDYIQSFSRDRKRNVVFNIYLYRMHSKRCWASTELIFRTISCGKDRLADFTLPLHYQSQTKSDYFCGPIQLRFTPV